MARRDPTKLAVTQARADSPILDVRQPDGASEQKLKLPVAPGVARTPASGAIPPPAGDG